ncbi:MAG: NAD(P)/FAD-dependent oxidoreductase [Candidatus Bathyarchaeota archaeon]|jgi:digeranylgeranylglycerophospholipid reductase|nr:NAD(P)/FAD-dependent oxidoreductase [Candidatus Bathyarchaeota archaeon A05DMB-3]MDH7606216.1 NAD(P)/FAD-dependent oxidoreductase [Candidatus Bathyarchaeota archaeon]
MKNFADVAVVGGGPCGSFCALNMAKKGVNVTVFEEHSEIGVPCHCAGHLSINSLKNLELYPLPRGIIENIFYGAKIYSPNGLEFSVRFASAITCAVNRALFDKHISRLAEKTGVRYCLSSRVESLITKESFVKGVLVKQKGETVKFFSSLVVDAEGTAYRILRQAGLASPRRESFVNCVNAEVENVKDLESDVVEVFLGNNYTPGFYAWLIPKGEDKAKVGLGARVGNPKTLLQKLMKRHPAASKKLQRAKIMRESFHPIPLSGPLPKAYSDGFLAVGDTASQVKPTTGGGVIFGLNCAKVAADVVAEALNKKDFSSKFLSIYQKRFMKLIGFDVKVMLEARRMLDRISDKKLDSFVGFCRKIHVNESFKDLKEIDFQGQTMLRACWNPRIIASFAYFFMAYFQQKLKG